MRYRLIVTTDGRDGVLERTYAAFDQLVRPRPTEVVVIDDAGNDDYEGYLVTLAATFRSAGQQWKLVHHRRREGFCSTVAEGWRYAAQPDIPWVVWLEDDMEVTRAVDLIDLAYVLECEPQLAQMALLRNPVNTDEEKVGGYINQYPDAYTRRGIGNVVWWETARNWTTNVSLFRSALAREYPWPIVKECEGVFGIKLRENRPGTTFGIWGDGSPWLHHDTDRIGSGY